MRNFKLWVRIAAVVQILTGILQSFSLVNGLEANNDTEEMLFNMMTSYKMQMGGGFEPTVAQLILALGGCFTLLCLMAGMINLYLTNHSLPPVIWKGLLFIELVVFTVCFGLMAIFTFLPPILLTGLILFSLFIARYGTKEHFTIG